MFVIYINTFDDGWRSEVAIADFDWGMHWTGEPLECNESAWLVPGTEAKGR